MNILKGNDLRTFEQLVSLSQNALKNTLSKFLRSKYEDVIETKEYIVAKGDIPIALVAHMDTVFKTPARDVFYDMRKNVLWSPDGLGADDRAGVFAIIQIIKSGLRPHIIFTTDEEIGGLGAMMLAELECPFDDLRYMIELDRRGTNDCVFYECDNKEFTDYVQGFGFIEAYGTFSDICELAPFWQVAAVNLSIGYQNEHSVSETLWINPMLATIEKVKKMLQEPVDEIPFFKFIPMEYPYRAYQYGFDAGWYWNDDYKKKNNALGTKTYTDGKGTAWGYPYDSDDIEYCWACGRSFFEEDLMTAVGKDGMLEYYCTDCLCNAVETDWCDSCTSLYIKDNEHNHSKKCAKCCQEEASTDGNNNTGEY